MAVTILLAAAVVVGPRAAWASCVVPPPVDEAVAQSHAAFVGTVTGLRDDDRTARFAVDEVWHGDVPAEVVVHGGPGLDALRGLGPGEEVATSVDRTYRPATRYLVVAHGAEGGVLLDSICSVTQPWDDPLAAFRPPTAAAPSSLPTALPPATSAAPVPWLVVGLVAAGVATVVAVPLALRRRAVSSAGEG